MRHVLLTIMAALAIMTAAAQSNSIYIEDFCIDRDSIVTVPVMLANETPLRGLQFYMSLPEGIKLDDRSLTKYSKKYEMNIVCRMTPDGEYAVFVYPMERICYPADTKAIINFDFAATADFKGGEIHMTGIKGSTIDNSSITIDDHVVKVTCGSGSCCEGKASH